MAISQLTDSQNGLFMPNQASLGGLSLAGMQQYAPAESCQGLAGQDGVGLQTPPQIAQGSGHHHHHHHQEQQGVSS